MLFTMFLFSIKYLFMKSIQEDITPLVSVGKADENEHCKRFMDRAMHDCFDKVSLHSINIDTMTHTPVHA